MKLRRPTKRFLWGAAALVAFPLIAFDLSMAHRQRAYITLTPVEATQSGPSTVALASSQDLSPAVPLDSPAIDYRQVRELVYLALDRDTSPGSLRSIVNPGDWVGIKVNMVSAPLIIKDRKIGGFWDGAVDNVPHWGSVSDLRVTKALIEYLIQRIGPRRISIMEGSGEIARTGSPYFSSYPIDGWTVTWSAFDSLSYQGIVDAANASQQGTTVDIVDLNDDDITLTDVPGGGLQLLGGQKRGWGYEDFKPGFGTPRGKWWVPQSLLKVDKLIDQPTLKTTAPGITVFLKNYVGTVGIRGYSGGPGKGAVIDNVAIMSGYMDMVRIRPPDYCLAAGFWSSDGWYGGTTDINHNVVIAGQNVVAAEAVAARIMGFNPLDLQQLVLARDVGLGSFDSRDYVVTGGTPAALMHRFPGNPNFRPSGFQEFLMLGPLAESDVKADALGGEATARPLAGAQQAGQTWTAYAHRKGYPEPYTDLSHLQLGDTTGKTMYYFTYVESDVEQDARIKFGSDGPARVWVNGELAVDNAAYSKYTVLTTQVHLNKGTNAVLAKTVGTYRGSGIGLSLTDGSRMLPELRPGLAPVPTAVSMDDAQAALPASPVLAAGYPNPFNSSVVLPFALPRDGRARVTVWAVNGQRVAVLFDGSPGAGRHQVVWHGQDDAARDVASGVYLVRLEVGDVASVQKVTLLR